MIPDPTNIDQSDRTPDEEVTSMGGIDSSKSVEVVTASSVDESMAPLEPEKSIEEALADTEIAPTIILSQNQNTKSETDEDDSSLAENGVESETGDDSITEQNQLSNGPPPLPSSQDNQSTTEPTIGTTEKLPDSQNSNPAVEVEALLNKTGEATEISPPNLPEQSIQDETSEAPTGAVNETEAVVVAPPIPEEVEPELTQLLLAPQSVRLKPGETHKFKLILKDASGGDVPISADMMANVKWEHGGSDPNQTQNGNYQAGRLSGVYTIVATLHGKKAESKVEIILPKPVWKELEPEDQTDPVDHEIHAEANYGDQWRVLAASVRGRLHAHKASWREDSYAFKNEGEWNILVMADGAGSANFSRIGSRIACDSSVDAMAKYLSTFKFGEGSEEQPSDIDLKVLKALLVASASDARNSILGEAHERACDARDFNTTFLLAIHIPWKGKHLVGAIQVGDGAIGVYGKDGNCTVLGVADHGEFSSETVFLTSKASDPLDQRVLFTIKSDVQCIGLMSDGVSDDFFPEKTNLVNLFKPDKIEGMESATGKEVHGIMHELAKKPKDAAFLAEWLKYVKKGSSDDRTLLLLINKHLISE